MASSSRSDELDLLANAWRSGTRDVGTAMELAYLLWSAEVEPSFVTGLSGSDASHRDLLSGVLSFLSKQSSQSLELSLVLGYLAWYAPWALGPEEEWKARSVDLLKEASSLAVKQGRSVSEKQLIDFYLDAALGQSANQPPPDCPGCFPDLFTGGTALDEYFGWIFAKRQAGGTA